MAGDPRFLIFDVETTGLPQDWEAPMTAVENWPRVVQIAWKLFDTTFDELETQCFIVKPVGFRIPKNAVDKHGITTERALIEGHPIEGVLKQFRAALNKTSYLVAHNIAYDKNIVGAEFLRLGQPYDFDLLIEICTMKESTRYCAIPKDYKRGYKWPKLQELHRALFWRGFKGEHDAAKDVAATAKCFYGLKKRSVILLARDVEKKLAPLRSLGWIHHNTMNPIDWHSVAKGADLIPPERSSVLEAKALEKYRTDRTPYLVRVLGLTGFRRRLQLANIESAKRADEANYKREMADFSSAVDLGKNAKAVLSRDDNALIRTLSLKMNCQWLSESFGKISYTSVGGQVEITLSLYPEEVVPATVKHRKEGGEVIEKKLTKKRQAAIFGSFACSSVVKAAADALAVLPLPEVNVLVFAIETETKNPCVLLRGIISRQSLSQRDFEFEHPVSIVKKLGVEMNYSDTKGLLPLRSQNPGKTAEVEAAGR